MGAERIAATTLGAAVALGVLMAVASAQDGSPDACSREQAGDPPREIYSCANGLVLEAEAAAAAGLTGANASISNGAAFIAIPAGQRFQITTPHAIASVRGTAFAVDVTGEGTAVFVADGDVDVQSRAGGAPVQLSVGEGVDVTPDDTMLEVRTWGAPRAAALLARFGR